MRKHRVKPYRDKRRPHLKHVVNFKEAGKRARQFFETKTEAETFAEQKNVELMNGGTEAAQFPSSLRVMAANATQLLSPFNKTINDAVNFYLPHLQATNRSCTFRVLIDELLKIKEKDGASVRYLGDLRSRLNQFGQRFDTTNVSDITATTVDEWLRALEVGPTTRNNFRRVLIVAFNYAKFRGYCLTNPAKESSKAKEVEGEVAIFTVPQLARLLESADAKLLPFLAIGAFAGLRRAELERLDWSEIDLAADLVQVKAEKAKSARRRFVRIEPTLTAWIQPHAQLSGPVTPSNYRELLDNARAAAKIEDWPQNGLRHSYASYHLAKFKDAAALALQLGHTNSNLVFQHYRQAVKPAEAERYWKIKPAVSSSRKKIVPFAVRS